MYIPNGFSVYSESVHKLCTTLYSLLNLQMDTEYIIGIATFCDAGASVVTELIQPVRTLPPPMPAERMLSKCNSVGVFDGYDWYKIPTVETYVDSGKYQLRKLQVGPVRSAHRENRVSIDTM